MSWPIYVIDAFAAKRFSGNPAAVCLLDDGGTEEAAGDETMQRIAAEMNLSETAFVQRSGDGGEFGLRWFTPKAEVDLCGHATLAAAHVLWEAGWLAEGAQAKFMTRSGLLTADRHGEWIQMDFPSEPPEAIEAPEELLLGLGLIPRYVGRNRMDYVVEVDNETTVRTLQPDFALLTRLDARGVVVTSRVEGGGEYDFVSRAFYPAVGVNEDPVTGSAHCALAPYWAKRLRKSVMTGYQASERGGTVRVEHAEQRVLLSGQAVTVLRGRLEEA